MKTINFKEFIKDYREYYNEQDKHFKIGSEEDMEDVIYDLYNVESYEVDYDRKIIELY